MNRRDFIICSGALLQSNLFGAATEDQVPWYRTMRRCGQTNFNERDPEVLDIEHFRVALIEICLPAPPHGPIPRDLVLGRGPEQIRLQERAGADDKIAPVHPKVPRRYISTPAARRDYRSCS